MKFWVKIQNLSHDNPVKKIYKLLLKDAQENNVVNWASLVRDLLTSRGFGDIWINQTVQNENTFLSKFNQRIDDMFLHNNNEKISNLNENRLYGHITENKNEMLCMSSYLTEINEKYLRIAITKFILGSHSFMIERGKWFRPELDYVDRVCESCSLVEYHIIIECKLFDVLRKKYV